MTSSTNPSSSNAAALSANAAGEARFFANAVASWYVNTIDPYAPHTQNIESRLRHPVHVVTRRILYGNVHATHMAGASVHGTDDLEALFNDDDAEIKDGPEALTRRSAARMEAFLASCSVALRVDEEIDERIMSKIGDNATASPVVIEGKGKNGKDKKKMQVDAPVLAVRKISISSSSSAPKISRQIDRGDLQLRLDLYCRT